MADITENLAGDYSPFGVHDYFIKNVLPNTITAQTRRISSPTPITQNNDQLVVLVRSGSGTITVNSIRYKIKKDTIISLGTFHRYSFAPDPGTVMEVAEGRMNAGTYVYVLACPYLKVNKMDVASEPGIAHLTGRLASMTERTMDDFLRESAGQARDRDKLCYCYMMELLGAMIEGISVRMAEERALAEK